MIVIKLTVEDLARTRFAISPMAITTISYRTLLFPELYPRHRGWASQTVTQMNGRQLKALSIVHPRGRRMPDFLTPLPSGPTETVEGEIRSLTQASVEDLRTDADIARRAAHHPADAVRISQFVEQVAAMRDHLTDDIWHYWEQVIRPAWREIEAILEGDILFRTQQMGKFGIDYMLANLAADVTFRDELLLITANTEARTTLSGQGLVLCPNPFADYTWFQRVGDGPVMLIYPARGAGNLGAPAHRPAVNERLSAMIGETKAQILGEADQPISTLQLAERLSMTSGAVSQHIGQLYAADLLQRQRVRRYVYYVLSQRGRDLIRLFEQPY
jgi:DNA-binding transcriptional ArsR family regulator